MSDGQTMFVYLERWSLGPGADRKRHLSPYVQRNPALGRHFATKHVALADMFKALGCTGITRVQLWIGPVTSETPGIVGIQVHPSCRQG
jgi:hypothetical protein